MRWFNKTSGLFTTLLVFFAFAGYIARGQNLGAPDITPAQMSTAISQALNSYTPMASAQVTTNAAGTYVCTYPAPCTSTSLFWAQPIVSSGFANIQNVGLPSGGSQTFQINVGSFTVVALLGLTILAVPASPGVQTINVFCR